LLTHGDFDHSGNARYLREKIGGKIDMHQGDKGIVEQDDLFSGQKNEFSDAWNRENHTLLFKK
jgi:hydroxyacylglutathione hydrolase